MESCLILHIPGIELWWLLMTYLFYNWFYEFKIWQIFLTKTYMIRNQGGHQFIEHILYHMSTRNAYLGDYIKTCLIVESRFSNTSLQTIHLVTCKELKTSQLKLKKTSKIGSKFKINFSFLFFKNSLKDICVHDVILKFLLFDIILPFRKF